MINGIIHRLGTGVQWHELPERFGPWQTVHKRHALWSADGTWDRLLQHVQAQVDAEGGIDWDVSVDSSVMRAHQHAAGAPKAAPPGGAAGALAWRIHHQGPPERGGPMPPAVGADHTRTAGGLHAVRTRRREDPARVIPVLSIGPPGSRTSESRFTLPDPGINSAAATGSAAAVNVPANEQPWLLIPTASSVTSSLPSLPVCRPASAILRRAASVCAWAGSGRTGRLQRVPPSRGGRKPGSRGGRSAHRPVG